MIKGTDSSSKTSFLTSTKRCLGNSFSHSEKSSRLTSFETLKITGPWVMLLFKWIPKLLQLRLFRALMGFSIKEGRLRWDTQSIRDCINSKRIRFSTMIKSEKLSKKKSKFSNRKRRRKSKLKTK